MMEGVPVSLLADMFHTSRQNVRHKAGRRETDRIPRRKPLYDIAHAAERLVKPKVDLAAYIKTLRPADVPVALQKQFWDAQNGRLKYMTDAEDLWHSVKVQMAIGDLFKLIRQRVQLLADTVERQTGLTDEQRRIIKASPMRCWKTCTIRSPRNFKVQGRRRGATMCSRKARPIRRWPTTTTTTTKTTSRMRKASTPTIRSGLVTMRYQTSARSFATWPNRCARRNA